MEPCSPVFTIDDRSRFPRPDFIREHWESLDGVWAFSFDQPVFDREITVPFCYQSEKSSIGETDDHEEVWYRRTFSVSQKDLTGRLLLHFGAVDYQARVWVNDRPAGEHTGGHAPFALDITELVQDGENCLTVQAIDRNDPHIVNREQCIYCMRCVSVCPLSVRKINPAAVQKVALMLQTVSPARRECELFL